MLSLNTGNLELNYPLGTEADTLLTPDLQLLMPGPGTVHLAVRVTPKAIPVCSRCRGTPPPSSSPRPWATPPTR